MTQQEKIILLALLAALLLGVAVRAGRRGLADSPLPALKNVPVSS